MQCSIARNRLNVHNPIVLSYLKEDRSYFNAFASFRRLSECRCFWKTNWESIRFSQDVANVRNGKVLSPRPEKETAAAQRLLISHNSLFCQFTWKKLVVGPLAIEKWCRHRVFVSQHLTRIDRRETIRHSTYIANSHYNRILHGKLSHDIGHQPLIISCGRPLDHFASMYAARVPTQYANEKKSL